MGSGAPSKPQGFPEGFSWERYYGEPPRPTSLPRGGLPFMACTARQLNLKPRDWDDPKYRQAYMRLLILDEGAANDDGETVFCLIRPGRRQAGDLLRFIKEHQGRGLQDVAIDGLSVKGKVYWLARQVYRRLIEEGFEVEVLKSLE